MNKKNKKDKKASDFKEYLNGQLKNKRIKDYFDEYGKQLEIAYQIMKLRKAMKMSQRELAEKIGTTQSNIARIESGRENFTVGFLNKIAVAFNKELKIAIR
jgi:DNA-binding XRE family transcriptional regulator